MGKISDVLDKIDTLEDITKEDHQHAQKQTEKTAPQTVSADNVTENLAISVDFSGKWDERLFKAVNSDSVMVEVFKTLRSKILHPLEGSKIPQSIMVGSSIFQEGKSFVAANLGVSFAKGIDHPCLLVDCDLRHPTLAHTFGINQKYGFVDYLMDQVDLAELIVETSVQNLSILPCGSVPNNPAELLSSSRMQGFIEDVSSRYEDSVIILDSPPMLIAAESIVLADQVDAIIMVVRQGRTKKTDVQGFVDVVDKTKILGIVFNDFLR